MLDLEYRAEAGVLGLCPKDNLCTEWEPCARQDSRNPTPFSLLIQNLDFYVTRSGRRVAIEGSLYLRLPISRTKLTNIAQRARVSARPRLWRLFSNRCSHSRTAQ